MFYATKCLVDSSARTLLLVKSGLRQCKVKIKKVEEEEAAAAGNLESVGSTAEPYRWDVSGARE
jgi:hypothetical protein